MDAYGGYLVDEKAVRVENAFLDFLKRFSSSYPSSSSLPSSSHRSSIFTIINWITVSVCVESPVLDPDNVTNYITKRKLKWWEPTSLTPCSLISITLSDSAISFRKLFQMNIWGFFPLNFYYQSWNPKFCCYFGTLRLVFVFYVGDDRFEPYLQNACKRFVMELKPTFISDDNPNKDINVAFYNIPIVNRFLHFYSVFHSQFIDSSLM